MRGYIQDKNESVESFLKEIVCVCKKHNMSISHEDFHGAFIVEAFSEKNIEWLMAASIEITKKGEK